MKSIFLLSLLAVPWLTAADYIANGARPDGKPQTMTFTRELTVGGDTEDENLVWTGNNVAVQVDGKGHMFVVDPMASRIVQLDPQGKFVRQIGQKGQGPGEFQLLNSFALLADGSAVVYDNNQRRNAFHYFDDQMNFVRSEVIQKRGRFLQSASYAPNGRYYSSCFLDYNPGDKKLEAKTGLLGLDKTVMLELSVIDQMMFDRTQRQNADYWLSYLSSWFRVGGSSLGVVAFGHDGSIYTANSYAYEVTRLDADLKKVGGFTREYKPIPWRSGELELFSEAAREGILGALPNAPIELITDSLVQNALEKAEFPPVKPAIMGMIPFEEGLLVIHDYKAQTGEVNADLFSVEGRFLGSTRLPDIEVNLFGGFFGSPMKMIFAGDRAYTIEKNEDGDTILCRYRYSLEKR